MVSTSVVSIRSTSLAALGTGEIFLIPGSLCCENEVSFESGLRKSQNARFLLTAG